MRRERKREREKEGRREATVRRKNTLVTLLRIYLFRGLLEWWISLSREINWNRRHSKGLLKGLERRWVQMMRRGRVSSIRSSLIVEHDSVNYRSARFVSRGILSPIRAPRLVGSGLNTWEKEKKDWWEKIYIFLPKSVFKSVFNNLNFGNIYIPIPFCVVISSILFTSMKNSWNICKDNLILSNLSPRFYQPFPRGNKRDSGHQWLETNWSPVSRVTRTIEKWTSRRFSPASHDALNSHIIYSTFKTDIGERNHGRFNHSLESKHVLLPSRRNVSFWIYSPSWIIHRSITLLILLDLDQWKNSEEWKGWGGRSSVAHLNFQTFRAHGAKLF